MNEQDYVHNRQNDEEDVIDLGVLLRDLLRTSKKVWWAYIIAPIVGIGIAFGVSYIRYTPLYRSTATFTVSTGDDSFYYSMNTADQMSETFPYLLDSSYFRGVLLEEMGTDILNGTITSSTIENSNMVTMTVTSPSRDDAQMILETALRVYPDAARFVLGQVEFHLLDDISTPETPYNRPSRRNLVLYGGGGGIALVVLLAGLYAWMNKTLKSTADIEKYFNMECVGVLPEVKQKARHNRQRALISILNPRMSHDYVESMRAVEVRLKTVMDTGRVILVTSTRAAEGKSTVAINLAEQLARNGAKVIFVDMDLRKQGDAKLLGVKDSVGIADILSGKENDGLRVLEEENMYFVGGSSPEKEPMRILRNKNLKQVLGFLRDQADYVIVDTPPCGMFPDAAILANYVDDVLYVIGYDKVTRSEISDSLTLLSRRKAKVVGYVMNEVPAMSSGGYGYGRYGYGQYGYYRSYNN